MSLDDRSRPGAPTGEVQAASDARRLRALTHPVRIALLGQLMLHGSLTSARASEVIGEPPSTCSFHFRQLAKYGFVEQTGEGTGRARPWRMTTTGLIGTGRDDPASQLAERELFAMVRERHFDRYRTWLQARAGYPRRWRDAGIDSAYVIWLTAGELEKLTADLDAIVAPLFGRRMTDPSRRPRGSVPVQLLLLSHPIHDHGIGDDEGAPG